MADVVEFPGKKAGEEPTEPTLQGPALCLSCRHEWRAVAPVGTTALQCPKCSRYWGIFRNMVEPDVAWTCKCGNQFFFLTPTGAMCCRCGTQSNDWAK